MKNNKEKSNLCALPTDVIFYIAMFCNKWTSIYFGYINRQWYIESQSQRYLLQRGDSQTYVDIHLVYAMQQANLSIYPFMYPTVITMNTFNKDFELSCQSKKFTNLFRRVNFVNVLRHNYLSFIPIGLLFGNKIRFNGRHDTIDSVYISVAPLNQFDLYDAVASMNQFNKNFSKFMKSNLGFTEMYLDNKKYDKIWNKQNLRKIK